MTYEAVIGLEIHAQLSTRSKIFSGSSTDFGAEPNVQASAVDLGLPGVLPVLNEQAVRMAVIFGLAVDGEIAERCIFARKNYFYPDLPKGYQISQYEAPIVIGGHVMITLPDGESMRINLTRAHLEEDAGKSVHDAFQGLTGVDLNRAGMPLIEIVSEPDMRSAAQAVAYMRKVHSIVRYLGICDGNMQEGSLRCDANVSLRPLAQDELGTRTEVKNLNSFRFLERAIEYEIERQSDVLDGGGTVVQETRLFDPERNETRPMRSKEEANDYRYFPDPDLLPVVLEAAYVQHLRAQLPELPDSKRERFATAYGLSPEQAANLTASREMADYFEACTKASGGLARQSANWIMGELSAAMNRHQMDITQVPVAATELGALLTRVDDGTISGTMAKQVFEAMWQAEGGGADAIIEARGMRQISDSGAIETLVDEVISANPDQLEQYRQGKQKVFGFFVGQVIKLSKGKANPKQVSALLKKRLQESSAG